MSDNQKHTPGPWRWVQSKDQGELPILAGPLYDESCLALSYEHEVCNFGHDGWCESMCGKEPSDADKALIAAAPDLLEALDLAWPFFEEDDGHGANSAAYQHAIDKVRAAIAKAKGGGV